MSLAKTTATLLVAISLANTTHGIATHDNDVHHDTVNAAHVEEHHKDIHDEHVAAPKKNPFIKVEPSHLTEHDTHSDVFDHINHEEHNDHQAAHPAAQPAAHPAAHPPPHHPIVVPVHVPPPSHIL